MKQKLLFDIIASTIIQFILSFRVTPVKSEVALFSGKYSELGTA